MEQKNKTTSIPHHKTVGGHLAGPVPTITAHTSIADAKALLRTEAQKFEDINYLYVITKERKFIGVVSIAALIASQHPETTLIQDLVIKKFPTIHPHTHQEHALRLAITHNVLSLPVVDKSETFMGALTPKDLIAILKEEHIEDILHFGGIHTNQPFNEVLKAKINTLLKLRLPWLIVGLAGGMIATFIVQFFEAALEARIMLAFFIPVIVYMSSAVGTQTQTLFIRALAFSPINTRRYIAREFIISFAIGIITSALIGIYTILLFSDVTIAIIISLAMLANIAFSSLVATSIPWFLFKLGKDPAIGSGPFATIIQDILSIVIYFTIAFSILS